MDELGRYKLQTYSMMFVVKIKRFTRICIYKQGIFNCTVEQYFFDYRMIHFKKESVLALLSINGLWDCIL